MSRRGLQIRHMLTVGSLGLGVAWAPALQADAAPPAVAAPEDGVPLRGLLELAARDALRLEGLKTRVSCSVLAHIDKLDGKGAIDSHTEIRLVVKGDGKTSDSHIVRVVEDGEDKTEEARKKQAEAKAKALKEKDEKKKKSYDLALPFLPAQQGKYVFHWAEIDAGDANRVRITFTPKEKGEDVYSGEAWVNRQDGTLLTMGFRPTKLPTFVSWLNVKLVFGAKTSAGPSLSVATAEGEGGFLFIRKRFRMDATLADYSVIP
jgi:hypothetical protein